MLTRHGGIAGPHSPPSMALASVTLPSMALAPMALPSMALAPMTTAPVALAPMTTAGSAASWKARQATRWAWMWSGWP